MGWTGSSPFVWRDWLVKEYTTPPPRHEPDVTVCNCGRPWTCEGSSQLRGDGLRRGDSAVPQRTWYNLADVKRIAKELN